MRVNDLNTLFAKNDKLKEITLSNSRMVFKHMGNNPMVGATVACAVAVEEAMKA